MARMMLTGFILALFLLVGGAPAVAQAQDSQLAEVSVTIPANGEASLPFTGMCLEYTEPFPDSFGSFNGMAPDEVRRILKYSLLNGYTVSDDFQVQMAIWRAIEGVWPYPDSVDRTLAEEIYAESQNVTLDPLEGEGVALDVAIADGSVTVTSEDFALTEPNPVAGGPYMGGGALTLKNNTDQAITVYYPFGLVLEAEQEAAQNLVTFATELEENPIATPTPAPTEEPTPPVLPPTGVSLGGSGGLLSLLTASAGLLILAGGAYIFRRDGSDTRT
ncbi:MAG: hypothetical protein KDD92_20065 [Caldilineaceae bacterium]|nr:hypothetical protein [Caldilineaceae bacterium]